MFSGLFPTCFNRTKEKPFLLIKYSAPLAPPRYRYLFVNSYRHRYSSLHPERETENRLSSLTANKNQSITKIMLRKYVSFISQAYQQRRRKQPQAIIPNPKPRIMLIIQFPSLHHPPTHDPRPTTHPTYNFANIFPPFSNCTLASATISSTISFAGFF